MFSNKSDVSDNSPIMNQRMTGVRSPGASRGGRRNFSLHTQHIGSILGSNRARSNTGSVLSNNSEVVQVQEEQKGSDLADLSNVKLPNYEYPKWSSRKNGVIICYAASTNQGISRNYNEDRVSIILNIKKPRNRKNIEWPKWAFFGIFDGHGGTNCSDYLRDYLHLFIIGNKYFPYNPAKAIMRGFKDAENYFLKDWAEKAEEQRRIRQTESTEDNLLMKYLDWSGSWAIVALIVEERWYIANVGDSRAIMSGDMGDKIFCLSNDHKPTNENEVKRIVSNGGKIYQTQTTYSVPNRNENGPSIPQVILGPPRVKPGRLSVSRTFGDIEAKVK